MPSSSRVPVLIAALLFFLSGSFASAQFTGDLIASHISQDSGKPRENYMDYSIKLALLLNGLTAEQRTRVFGNYVPGYVAPVSLTQQLGMGSVTFGSMSSDLSPSSFAELDKVLDYLNQNPNAKILIEGHTDANKSYDQALSESRADAAKLYLAQNGVDPDRIDTIGYAGTQFLNANKTKAEKSANRRIEVQLAN